MSNLIPIVYSVECDLPCVMRSYHIRGAISSELNDTTTLRLDDTTIYPACPVAMACGVKCSLSREMFNYFLGELISLGR